MPQNKTIITTVTAAGATLSSTTIGSKAPVNLWPHGIIGYSFTRYDATQTFWLNIYSTVAGVSFQIAGISGIASTASGILPPLRVNNTVGITQFSWDSMPTPTHIYFRGTSTGAGLTGVAVVTCSLYSP
jgi:hypothetical protein